MAMCWRRCATCAEACVALYGMHAGRSRSYLGQASADEQHSTDTKSDLFRLSVLAPARSCFSTCSCSNRVCAQRESSWPPPQASSAALSLSEHSRCASLAMQTSMTARFLFLWTIDEAAFVLVRRHSDLNCVRLV